MYRIVLYWLKLYQLPQHVSPRASDSVWTPQNAWPAAGKHWLSVKSVMVGQHGGAREHVVRDKLAGQYILYEYVVPCRRQITAVGPERLRLGTVCVNAWPHLMSLSMFLAEWMHKKHLHTMHGHAAPWLLKISVQICNMYNIYVSRDF